jgi:hypothetical protein
VDTVTIGGVPPPLARRAATRAAPAGSVESDFMRRTIRTPTRE